MNQPAYYLFFVILIPFFSEGQQSLRGKIYNAAGDEVLSAVSVRNITGKKSNVSDLGGNFKIVAIEGDSLIFSSAGYFADTIRVTYFMLTAGYDISLRPHASQLATVTVTDQYNKYQVDSLSRRDYYKSGYIKKKMVNDSFPSGGFGVRFSVFDFFSSREKHKRKFRKRLEQQEKEDYIDYKFSAGYIAHITRLHGDSLRMFMLQYRPSYAFCRRASAQDMLFYVSDQMKKFMRREKA